MKPEFWRLRLRLTLIIENNLNTPRDLVNITPPDIKFSRADFTFDRVIKTTTSICPECLEKIPAEVVEKDSRVFMLKTCEKHGDFSALLASDVRHYYVADPAVEQVACCCGPSHTVVTKSKITAAIC